MKLAIKKDGLYESQEKVLDEQQRKLGDDVIKRRLNAPASTFPSISEERKRRLEKFLKLSSTADTAIEQDAP
jgi:hypothetical protein